MKQMVFSFSGWCSISPEKVKFQYIGLEDKETIDGNKWLALSEDERSDYVVESIIDIQREAEDGLYDNVSFDGLEE